MVMRPAMVASVLLFLAGTRWWHNREWRHDLVCIGRQQASITLRLAIDFNVKEHLHDPGPMRLRAVRTVNACAAMMTFN